jgi:mono/diheme cytochrome c family protein
MVGAELATPGSMSSHCARIAFAVVVGLLVALGSAAAPDAPADPPADTGAGTQEASGRMLYLRYCGACHGALGRGDGPVASALGEPPADLSQIASRNGGVFPYEAVLDAIDGTTSVRGHGVSEMPVWGEVFRGPPGWPLEQRLVEAGKILMIADHLRSLQVTKTPVH